MIKEYVARCFNANIQYLRCEDVKTMRVPHFKGLKIEDVIDFARSKVPIDDYLPILAKGKLPNRDWMINVGELTS